MKRAQLIYEIEALDQRLTRQVTPLQRQTRKSIRALEQINPLWFMGAGFVTGLLTGKLGWRSAYSIGALGFQMQSLLHSGIQSWMGGGEM